MRARENARPSFARRALACLVSAAMCVAFTPAVAWGEGAASGELDVSQGGITITATGYTIGGGSETAYTGAYTITGTAAQAAGSSSIVVASGTHEITLKDASIDVSKDSDAGSYTVDYNVANNSTNVPTGSLQYLHATIAKATPSLGIEASQAKLNGGGTVTLAMSGALAGEEPVVSCDNGIDVSPNGDGTYTAVLPDETKSYTFLCRRRSR